LYLHGKKIAPHSAKAALEAGIGYVSEDRKSLGLILIQTIKNNISASSLKKKFSRFGLVLSAKEIAEAERYRRELRIKTPSINQLARNLSGGNQQKVVVSRILLADPDIFIVDEPTRGIDIGAKTEIYEILSDLVARGKSVIMISSELPEVLGMADRICIMNEGKIKGVLDHDEATQEKIMHMALVG
jgi:putative multiple sugar transport system ATP-binding protein